MKLFKKIKAFLQFREAVLKADEAHVKSGDRFYVVNSKDGSLVIMNRKEFRKLKQKHYINRSVKIRQLEDMTVYHTPYANGYGEMSPEEIKLKRKTYIQWMTSQEFSR